MNKSDPLSEEQKALITAAELAVDAVEGDSLSLWTRGLEACEDPDDSPIGRALKEVREFFWHEGSFGERERLTVAAARLKFRLRWKDEANG